MKVVIVGGVAGGATAAARLRRLDEAAEIVVFERSGYISYANCGLPYYIGGTIADQERPHPADPPKASAHASTWTCAYTTKWRPSTRRAMW